jgi:hypothetical protein
LPEINDASDYDKMPDIAPHRTLQQFLISYDWGGNRMIDCLQARFPSEQPPSSGARNPGWPSGR